MKPTYKLVHTAHAATSSTSAQTAQLLAPLMAAAAQTMRLGEKRSVASIRPASTKRPTGPLHRIVHGECLEMMAKIPDHSIDFICADFPYNISGKGGLTMS